MLSGRKRSLIIAFDSKTGNVRRFINKLDLPLPAVQIQPDLVLDEPFILVTYTTGFGQVPDKVNAFLKRNHRLIRGVAASGNRNWGTSFARSADTISDQYKVPMLAKFELSGTTRDLELFRNGVESIATH
jgi:protein involved in ribonucleotide reduction